MEDLFRHAEALPPGSGLEVKKVRRSLELRKVANGHSRTTLTRGRTVGEQGFCLESKLGLVISLKGLKPYWRRTSNGRHF